MKKVHALTEHESRSVGAKKLPVDTYRYRTLHTFNGGGDKLINVSEILLNSA